MAMLDPIAADSTYIPFWSAFRHRASQVFTREPGKRIHGNPQAVQVEAVPDRYYAWPSNAAYGRSVTVKKRRTFFAWLLDILPFKARRETNPHGSAILEQGGWAMWDDF